MKLPVTREIANTINIAGTLYSSWQQAESKSNHGAIISRAYALYYTTYNWARAIKRRRSSFRSREVARSCGSDVARSTIWRTLDNVNRTVITAARMWVSFSLDFSAFCQIRGNSEKLLNAEHSPLKSRTVAIYRVSSAKQLYLKRSVPCPCCLTLCSCQSFLHRLWCFVCYLFLYF